MSGEKSFLGGCELPEPAVPPRGTAVDLLRIPSAVTTLYFGEPPQLLAGTKHPAGPRGPRRIPPDPPRTTPDNAPGPCRRPRTLRPLGPSAPAEPIREGVTPGTPILSRGWHQVGPSRVTPDRGTLPDLGTLPDSVYYIYIQHAPPPTYKYIKVGGWGVSHPQFAVPTLTPPQLPQNLQNLQVN